MGVTAAVEFHLAFWLLFLTNSLLSEAQREGQFPSRSSLTLSLSLSLSLSHSVAFFSLVFFRHTHAHTHTLSLSLSLSHTHTHNTETQSLGPHLHRARWTESVSGLQGGRQASDLGRMDER